MNNLFANWNSKEELYALYLSLIIMFGYPFNMYIEFAIAAIWAYSMKGQTPTSMLNCKSHKYFLAGLLVWTFSCIYSVNSIFALKYMFMAFAAYIVCINTSNQIFQRMLKYFLVLGGIHIAFILIDFLDHMFVMSIAGRFLGSEQIEVNEHLRAFSGACSGLTGQTGQAALFVVIFMYTVAAIAAEKKVYILLLAPAIIAMLLTQKRSFLGFGLLFSVGYILYTMKNISNMSKIMVIVIAAITCWALQHYIELYFDVTAIADKIEGGSMSNRDVLWNKMMILFNSSPLFGIGLYSTDTILGMTGHNIYIQLFCENGIFGALVWLALLFRSLKLVIMNNLSNDIVAFSRITILFILAYGFLGNPIYEIQTLFLLFICTTVLERSFVENSAQILNIKKSDYGK